MIRIYVGKFFFFVSFHFVSFHFIFLISVDGGGGAGPQGTYHQEVRGRGFSLLLKCQVRERERKREREILFISIYIYKFNSYSLIILFILSSIFHLFLIYHYFHQLFIPLSPISHSSPISHLPTHPIPTQSGLFTRSSPAIHPQALGRRHNRPSTHPASPGPLPLSCPQCTHPQD